MTKLNLKKIIAGIMAGASAAAYMAIPAAAGTVNVGGYTGNYSFYVGTTYSRVDASLNLDPTYYNVTVTINADYTWKLKDNATDIVAVTTQEQGTNNKNTNGLNLVGYNPDATKYTGYYITARIYYSGAGVSYTTHTLDSRTD